MVFWSQPRCCCPAGTSALPADAPATGWAGEIERNNRYRRGRGLHRHNPWPGYGLYQIKTECRQLGRERCQLVPVAKSRLERQIPSFHVPRRGERLAKPVEVAAENAVVRPGIEHADANAPLTDSYADPLPSPAAG